MNDITKSTIRAIGVQIKEFADQHDRAAAAFRLVAERFMACDLAAALNLQIHAAMEALKIADMHDSILASLTAMDMMDKEGVSDEIIKSDKLYNAETLPKMSDMELSVSHAMHGAFCTVKNCYTMPMIEEEMKRRGVTIPT